MPVERSRPQTMSASGLLATTVTTAASSDSIGAAYSSRQVT
jgi:hypothetical protein